MAAVSDNDRETQVRQLEPHNLLALSAYSVLLRFAWIFKTESVIIPAALKEKGQSGFIDHESSKPEKIAADITSLFATVNPKKSGVLIVHGWTMAESLVKLGSRS